MLLHVASLVPLLSPPSGETWQAKLKHPEYLRPERGALEGKLGFARGTEHFHYFVDALCPSSPLAALYQGSRRVVNTDCG